MNVHKLFAQPALFARKKARVYISQKKFQSTSTLDASPPTIPTIIPLETLINSRRSEAGRSIIVQVKNDESFPKLFSYVSQFGNIKNSFFYSLNSENNFFLIEFDAIESYKSVLSEGKFLELNGVVPVQSPLMWFRLSSKFDVPLIEAPKPVTMPLVVSSSKLDQLLDKAEDFSDEMLILYKNLQLNDLGSRLRFLSAHLVETAFKGLFPVCSILPFGSTINGFGKLNCDLDLILTLEDRIAKDESRLIFHSKSVGGGGRINNQRYLETVADVLQFFLPGCSQIKRILRARVPILRYKQDFTDVDCDLSSSNLSGFYMSELLYMFGTYDWRVCPLVFTVRHWAKEIGITNPAPGKWISNFALSLLVLFYLQHEKIIPTLEALVEHKRPIDFRSFDDVDCSFLRDLNLLPRNYTKSDNRSLVELLLGFFQFYSSFDFGSYALSLNTGGIIPKPEYSALYIVNPLEKYLNVTKNVSPDECERMKMCFHSAAWNMECSLNANDKWGLRNLIKSHLMNRNTLKTKHGSMKNSKFTVQTLFEENSEPMNWKIPH